MTIGLGARANALWGLYAIFAGLALYTNWHATLFRFDGPLGGVKLVFWLLFLGFLAYSVYCSSREDLFRTLGVMARLWWGRQVGIDLYLGLLIGMLIIYMNDGLSVALLWLVPTLLFANLSILLYVLINFDTLVGKILG